MKEYTITRKYQFSLTAESLVLDPTDEYFSNSLSCLLVLNPIRPAMDDIMIFRSMTRDILMKAQELFAKDEDFVLELSVKVDAGTRAESDGECTFDKDTERCREYVWRSYMEDYAPDMTTKVFRFLLEDYSHSEPYAPTNFVIPFDSDVMEYLAYAEV